MLEQGKCTVSCRKAFINEICSGQLISPRVEVFVVQEQPAIASRTSTQAYKACLCELLTAPGQWHFYKLAVILFSFLFFIIETLGLSTFTSYCRR